MNSFIIKIVEGTKKCIRSICAKLSGKKPYGYKPIHLMRSEIEIESLLDEECEMPQVRFIPPPPKKEQNLFTLDAIDSFGNVTSFNENDAIQTMTESEFYSCEDVSDEEEEDIFRVLAEEGGEIDFFHNSKVL